MRYILFNRLALMVCTIFLVQDIVAQDTQSDLENLFAQTIQEPGMHFNGVILVAEQGKIVFQRTNGYANIAVHDTNSLSTRFQLASLSKVFTAVAVMQLAERKKINIDDKVNKTLSDFPYDGITIRQLLDHTSGLPDFRDLYKRGNSPEVKGLTIADILPELKKYGPLPNAPGQRWSYSSVGYVVLALIVEKTSGISFSEYIITNICKPAGMSDTYILTASDIHPDPYRAVSYVDSRSPGTSLNAADTLRKNLNSPWQMLPGPGLIVSSAKDLLLFDQALYTDKILSSATCEEMYTIQKLTDGSNARLEHAPIYAGLGWGIDIDESAGKIVSHNGGSPGISTILLRNIDKKQTVIVLENTDNMAPLSFGVNAMNVLNHRPLHRFGPPGRP